jgi:hypothetical protein
MNLGYIIKFVDLIVNKDQSSGYMDPVQSTVALRAADVFYRNDLKKKYEKDQTVTDITRTIVRTLGTGDYPVLVLDSDGFVDLPEDYDRLSSASIVVFESSGDCKVGPNTRRFPISVFDDEQFVQFYRFQLKKPTIKNPVGTIENNRFRVLPAASFPVLFTYWIRTPEVFYDWTESANGSPVYLPPGSFHNGSVLPDGTPSRSVEFPYGGLDWLNDVLPIVLQQFGASVQDDFASKLADFMRQLNIAQR